MILNKDTRGKCPKCKKKAEILVSFKETPPLDYIKDEDYTKKEKKLLEEYPYVLISMILCKNSSCNFKYGMGNRLDSDLSSSMLLGSEEEKRRLK